MKWLEKRIEAFFKLNAILFIASIFFNLLGFLIFLGIPDTFSKWIASLKDLLDFIGKDLLIGIIIYMIFVVLFFRRKYVAFPIFTFYALFIDPLSAIKNLSQIFVIGFFSPGSNIYYAIGALLFVFSVIGTILWIRKLRGKGKEKIEF